jgi:beta-amylase
VDDPDLFFTDQYGYRNPEVISLWADNAKTLEGRTPLECYGDFMRSFRDSVEAAGLTETLSEISVGCGPCGELRYPAYPENKQRQQSSQWQFPGIGEFQARSISHWFPYDRVGAVNADP